MSQYTHRLNVIVRNVFHPENESDDQINKKVVKIIKDELNLPNVVDDVDKLHRVGKIKQRNGEKTQDIIIKSKTHT